MTKKWVTAVVIIVACAGVVCVILTQGVWQAVEGIIGGGLPGGLCGLALAHWKHGFAEGAPHTRLVAAGAVVGVAVGIWIVAVLPGSPISSELFIGFMAGAVLGMICSTIARYIYL